MVSALDCRPLPMQTAVFSLFAADCDDEEATSDAFGAVCPCGFAAVRCTWSCRALNAHCESLLILPKFADTIMGALSSGDPADMDKVSRWAGEHRPWHSSPCSPQPDA